MCFQDSYEELVMTVGSRRSGLNQNMALQEQYERALQDLTDLVDTARDKMAADQRIIASSMEEVQNHLDKHKVWLARRWLDTQSYCSNVGDKILRDKR